MSSSSDKPRFFWTSVGLPFAVRNYGHATYYGGEFAPPMLANGKRALALAEAGITSAAKAERARTIVKRVVGRSPTDCFLCFEVYNRYLICFAILLL